MNYSIGEVSDILHLSRDMIRYYEKQGTIHSKRNSSNNYRYYDEMDIFWLLEAIQHKSWGSTFPKYRRYGSTSTRNGLVRALRI